jgi:8-amino-3,8-dideoxy-alpha-D-manno-octulosonate transaminase
MGIGNDLIGDLEQLLVNKVIGRKSLFRMIGAHSQCAKAENEIGEMFPGMSCLLLPSATIGIAMVLELLNLKPRQEVLISPFGWIANWSCIQRAGLVPKFLPLDKNLQLDVDAVRARINERTGAVIVTHLQGRGQQRVAEIAALCEEAGVFMFEDIAQSFGVSIDRKRAGTFGDAAWGSFNHNKILSAGDGGFLLVRNKELYLKVCALHDQGNILIGGKRRRQENNVEPGLSLRVNESTGAIVRAQVARFHYIRARVNRLNSLLQVKLKDQFNSRILPTYSGDIPFTVLFEKLSDSDYPTMADTGWHVALEVPWLSDFCHKAMCEDSEINETIHTLDAVSAIGAGFIDPYYGIKVGVEIAASTDDVDSLITELKEVL